MRKDRFFLMAISVALIFFSIGCGDEGDIPMIPDENSSTPRASFDADLLPIFRKSCALSGGCHAGISPPKGLNFSSYDEMVKNGSDIGIRIVGQIESGNMPLGGVKLPDREIATIRSWFDANKIGGDEDR